MRLRVPACPCLARTPPFLTLLAPRSDVGTRTCLQVVCTCHARAFPPLLCAIRRDRFRGPTRAAKGGAGDLPRPLLDSSRNGGLRPLEAAAAASSPSPKGGLAAPFVPALAAAEPAIATAVATAVSAALAAHLAALTATHDHPRPMPHVSRAAALCGR